MPKTRFSSKDVKSSCSPRLKYFPIEKIKKLETPPSFCPEPMGALIAQQDPNESGILYVSKSPERNRDQGGQGDATVVAQHLHQHQYHQHQPQVNPSFSSSFLLTSLPLLLPFFLYFFLSFFLRNLENVAMNFNFPLLTRFEAKRRARLASLERNIKVKVDVFKRWFRATIPKWAERSNYEGGGTQFQNINTRVYGNTRLSLRNIKFFCLSIEIRETSERYNSYYVYSQRSK